ncbi:beta-propeller fold lactonase family protein, partial [Bacillus sp. SM2101]|uniref:YncE family protein n=1 Tax=Bacillus sp. SM2101 TaxID=2805366 RepID=UPI001BDEF5DD
MATVVIDVSTHRVIVTLLPAGISSVSVTPDGKLAYVTNLDDDIVSVIDVKTLKVVATILIEQGPIDVAFTPDGKLAYVINSDSEQGNTVTVIDVKTHSIIATIMVGL